LLVSSISRYTSERLRIIVLGYIVRMPLGGLSWHYLQYLLALARLGHDVYYIEDSHFFENDANAFSYDPTKNTYSDPAYGLQYSTNTFNSVELGDRWAYYDAPTSRWLGPFADRILKICQTADLLINVGGVNPLRPWLMQIPVRVLVDTDPVFSQIRYLTNPINRQLALQHTAFFSYGENIRLLQSAISKDTLPWQATRQPIVLDAWPVTLGPRQGKFTTVGAWESYKMLEYEGVCYGMKSQSFAPYWDFPARARDVFELSLFDPSALPELFRNAGWVVTDARDLIRDPWSYQRYIRESKAEFSVAKHGYVISRCGWFSERSASYLASGRPILVQDTGFSDWLATGSGVIAFNTPEEALSGVADINNRYEFHCKAAREIADEYFDGRRVLFDLVERAINSW
jgi:hypothetical protein